MRRERFREHVTHLIGPSPVMFDDLVGDPGHPSLLNAPPSPAVARDASFLISRAAPRPMCRRVSCESGRNPAGSFCSGDAKGRAAHRSAPPAVGHASDQATFKFVADSLPLFRSASTSYVTFMPSARPFIPDRSTALMWTNTSLPP